MIVLLLFILLILSLVIINTFVFLTGAPYAPTLNKTIKNLFKVMPLSNKDIVYDLGSGDGRILIEVAQKGAKSIGYEINPFLVLLSKWRVRNIDSNVKPKIYLGNFWNKNLSDATVIFVFILPQYMDKLDKKLTKELQNKTLVILHHGSIANRKPIKKLNGLNIYKY